MYVCLYFMKIHRDRCREEEHVVIDVDDDTGERDDILCGSLAIEDSRRPASLLQFLDGFSVCSQEATKIRPGIRSSNLFVWVEYARKSGYIVKA